MTTDYGTILSILLTILCLYLLKRLYDFVDQTKDFSHKPHRPFIFREDDKDKDDDLF